MKPSAPGILRLMMSIGVMGMALFPADIKAQGIQIDREPAVGECAPAMRGSEAIRVCNENGRFVIRPREPAATMPGNSQSQQRNTGQAGAREGGPNQNERVPRPQSTGSSGRGPATVVPGDPTIPFTIAFSNATGRRWSDASDVSPWYSFGRSHPPGEIASWNFVTRGKPRNIEVVRGCKESDDREYKYFCEISFVYTPANAPPHSRTLLFSRVPPSAANLMTAEDDEAAIAGGCSAVFEMLSRPNAVRLIPEVRSKIGSFLRGIPFETRSTSGFTHNPRNVTGRDPPWGKDEYALSMERGNEAIPDEFASVTYTSTLINCFVSFYANPKAQ